ncbi:MHYT domain-containing protein [Siccirubricoccus sp. G192]|uniref:MHYT domain-containing protein n=1 Tax=Siccirubricoccus sp. G192 TaxID=2849651 RepID=UPI002111B057|nr:MHYT domain-containing protein [Siccirubricoccus sp. G192]
MHHLHSTHDPVLVSLSIAIAVLGSWTALDLLRRVRANAGAARRWWLGGAAIATGAAIWSMHFVAMLAYDIDIAVRYNFNLTALSFLLAIAATASGFALVSSPAASPAPGRIAFAGIAMGLGICLMHYVGMAAMRLAATPSYDAMLVVVSGLVAVGASTLALMLALRDRPGLPRAISALVLGLAITGMHYTAMAAVSFSPTLQARSGGISDIPAQALAIGIAACTLLLLSLALTAAMFDRRLELMASREAEALRRSEQRLRAILGQMPIGVIVADAASGKVVLSNPEAERVLGHPLGHIPDWHAYTESFGGLHSDGRPLTADEYPLARAVLRRERVDREPLLYRRGDRSVVHLEVSATPVRDDDSQLELVIAAFQDVTAQVQAEQALRRAQRLEAMGQLTGGVAHDFNNLLMVASGNLQLLTRRTSDEVLLRFARGAMDATRRGADVTRRLLAFAREQPLDAVPIDLAVLLPDITENVLSRTLGGTVRVKTEVEPGLWPALADRGELQAALLNLAINARDAMPGGGELTISAGNAGSDALPDGIRGDLPPGDYVAVSVSDTGFGMAEEVAARAFEPFFTTKDIGRGSGLGLSQVYGFAQQSGGGCCDQHPPGQRHPRDRLAAAGAR